MFLKLSSKNICFFCYNVHTSLCATTFLIKNKNVFYAVSYVFKFTYHTHTETLVYFYSTPSGFILFLILVVLLSTDLQWSWVLCAFQHSPLTFASILLVMDPFQHFTCPLWPAFYLSSLTCAGVFFMYCWITECARMQFYYVYPDSS